MEERTVSLELCLQGDSGLEADQLDREARQLRSELQEIDFGSVTLKAGQVPRGGKSLDGLALGGIVMELLPSAISPLIKFLRAWIGRREGRRVKVKAAIKHRSVEMEFDPVTITPEEVKALAASLIKELDRAER